MMVMEVMAMMVMEVMVMMVMEVMVMEVMVMMVMVQIVVMMVMVQIVVMVMVVMVIIIRKLLPEKISGKFPCNEGVIVDYLIKTTLDCYSILQSICVIVSCRKNTYLSF